MKLHQLSAALVAWLITVGSATAAVRYVDLNSATPTPPYTNWLTAATKIQDAVDAAIAGDQILVTNGVYKTGAWEVNGMSNRVAVTKAVTVLSVNGPAVTRIQGYQVPGTTNGPTAVRCVYLASGAVLVGFTLNDGATQTSGDMQMQQSGGGIVCESLSAVVSNCVLTGNSAYYGGGGASGGTLNHCVVTSNSVSATYGYGGGVSGSKLNNCVLTGNSANGASGMGGGASSSTLNDCTLTGNTTGQFGYGGGASYGTLNDCTLTGNSAYEGGGVWSRVLNGCRLNRCTLTANLAVLGGGALNATLNNCTLTGNSATDSGGGGYGGILNNCTLTGNSAGRYGGGAYFSTLTNCTLTTNSTTSDGGGAYGGTLNNCILYYNTGPYNASRNYQYPDTILSYCCTTPRAGGIGNITNAPLFVDLSPGGNLRLLSNSPCINAGNNSHALAGTDLDGNARIKGVRVDIGAYEFQGAGLGDFTAWLWQYGLRTDGSSDYADTDRDLMNNWQEWSAGTIPTSALSALRLLNPSKAASGVTVTWQSVSNRTYFLDRATNLGAAPPFSLLTSNLVGQAGATTYTDTNATGPGPFFYRVGVQQ